METNQNKVLVLGASGSLGKAIALKLDEQHDVVGTYCTKKIKSNIKTAQVDITKKGSLDALEKGFISPRRGDPFFIELSSVSERG